MAVAARPVPPVPSRGRLGPVAVPERGRAGASRPQQWPRGTWCASARPAGQACGRAGAARPHHAVLCEGAGPRPGARQGGRPTRCSRYVPLRQPSTVPELGTTLRLPPLLSMALLSRRFMTFSCAWNHACVRHRRNLLLVLLCQHNCQLRWL